MRCGVAIAERTADERVEILNAAAVLNQKVNDFGDVLADPHARSTRAFAGLEHDVVGRVPLANAPGAPPIPSTGPLTEAPRLAAWYERLAARPAMIETVPKSP